MLFPAYDLLFGKLALRCLFEDYFEQAGKLNTRIMLKPIEDPHVDLVATVSCVVMHAFSDSSFYKSINSFFFSLVSLDSSTQYLHLYYFTV